MPKFRKKPVVIEAIQLLNDPMIIKQVEEFIEGHPIHLSHPVGSDKFDEYVEIIRKQGGRKIRTLESHDADLLASFGDWIIKGVNGEFYPCKPDIFEKTYELVSEQ